MAHLRLVETPVRPAPRGRAILRLVPGDGPLLDAIARLPVDVAALTVSQHLRSPGLATLARRTHGLEVIADPEAWHNHAPPAARPKGFERCGYALEATFDPDRHTLSPRDERAYLRACLEAQIAAQATRLLAPHHLAGGPASPSRSLDLRLAQRAIDLLPQLDRDPARSLHVGLAVGARQARSPLDRAWLASRYGSLPAAGLHVLFPHLTERSHRADVEAAAELLAALREAGAATIAVATTPTLALPLVATGLADAAVLAATGVYHPASLRRIAPEASSAAGRRAASLFAASPCSCEHHRRDRYPAPGSERRLHTATQLALDIAASPANAGETYRRRVATADQVTMQTGYPPIPRSVLAVVDVARRAERRRARDQLV